MTTDPDDGKPRYQTFERTDARLRPDQVTALSELRKRVAANRTDRTERITDNTMLRLAVDLLLKNATHITGNTEEEMRRALLKEDTES
jgi:RNA polymerase-interacting CarD/CdnL/TRCF family regulator